MDTRIPRILTNCAGHCSLGLGGAVRELLELVFRLRRVPKDGEHAVAQTAKAENAGVAGAQGQWARQRLESGTVVA
jgi:hypothetical protein